MRISPPPSPSSSSSCRACHQRHRRLAKIAVVLGVVYFLGTSETILLQSITFLSTLGVYVDTDNEEFNLQTMQTLLIHKAKAMEADRNNDNNKKFGKDDTKKTKKRQRIKSIHFIGERHSGTTWMYNHLRRCFSDSLPIHMGYTRFKHWFQYDNATAMESHRGGPHALVIAQFREPYSWVEAMRRENHHAPMHAGLGWYDFVNLDWWMPRPKKDLLLSNETGRICGQNFFYHEVVPCSAEVFEKRGGHPRYELRIDGSGRPYQSIVEMRRDKIRNFLQVARFAGVAQHLAVRYEDIVEKGTGAILARLEEMTGVQAKCQPKPKQNLTVRTYHPPYIEWMNRHVDWSSEALLGYGRCDEDYAASGICYPTQGPMLDMKGQLPDMLV